jgi:hypothetical protein
MDGLWGEYGVCRCRYHNQQHFQDIPGATHALFEEALSALMLRCQELCIENSQADILHFCSEVVVPGHS